MSCYTTQLIKYAHKLDQVLSVDYDAEKFIYTVFINMVGYKDGYVRKPIKGRGYTIEDACCDFIRLCRGGSIVHYITDQEIQII